MAQSDAVFLTGSIMRHVIVMTLSASLGLIFMFVVEAATLFWVAQLGDHALIAALGFAWTIQFLAIAVNIGLTIAGNALVARMLGEGDIAEAKARATSALWMAVFIQSSFAALVFIFRDQLLTFAGAEGATRDIAASFLFYSLPSLPIMAAAMMSAAILRAKGDALRAMYVTLIAGVIVMILDPLVIIHLGMGVDGAGMVVFVCRLASAGLGLWFLGRTHGFLGWFNPHHAKAFFTAFFAIVLPAILSQIAAPFGNYVVTIFISPFGDEAVAGWAVVSRLTVVAFGGIFALSGAVGGIIGQNFGAGLMPRVAQTYRDSMVFCVVYVLVIWVILALGADIIADLFNLSGEGAVVARDFCIYVSITFVFVGALFVANAALNNLGKPMWSTWLNWFYDGVLIAPFAMLLPAYFGASGAVYAQAVAGIIAGSLAYVIGARYIKTLARAGGGST